MTETTAKILADSVSPAGHRLTTFEAIYPRIVLAEVNTHRLLSRNSASSRAIPIEKMLQRVMEDPYVPTHWGKNQKGMQAEQDVSLATANQAVTWWKFARDQAVRVATMLVHEHGIHKQITNRLLEPFMWHPTIITATEWDNFWHLRDHKAAHPDLRDVVHAMRVLWLKSEPKKLSCSDWHMPLIADEDYEQMILKDPTHPVRVQENLCKVSVGRCARVSTLTHDGKRDLQADIDLHDKMAAAGHTSPYEHVARPMTPDELEIFKQKKMRWDPEHKRWFWVGAKYRNDQGDRGAKYESCTQRDPGAEYVFGSGEFTHFLGNIQGWVQLRKQIPHEEDILGERP